MNDVKFRKYVTALCPRSVKQKEHPPFL
ncbi:unnamed protein product [Tetraodon nigroviridis]|uniref:Chromosome 7 SCAF14703, whole genome shotgun sequence n=1 Tax=Tetraodon nigroviridis TaxID=99883 RepID=Q4S8P5_TETNG|nr:unnamed protein product [Tetraodon nigroviridis]